MRIPYTVLPVLRLLTVAGFAVLCAVIFGFLWLNSGGRIPLISQSAYQISVPLEDADNLVEFGDVKSAGVDIGSVRSITVSGGTATALLELSEQVAPLHEGAVVTVRNKTLIEETYLDIDDGPGAVLASGSTLPGSAARGSVQVDDVLASLDPETKDALASGLRNAATATDGRAGDIGSLVGGLGDIGREGGGTLIALSEQSEDLRTLSANTATVLEALDTRRGQIAELVGDSQTVFETVAENRENVEGLVRRLPPLLTTAQEASGSLETLAGSLAPVAANLNASAPALSAALEELPATSRDLRGLLPSLDLTLERSPDTLERVPAIVDDVQDLVPTLQVNLSDLNPALAFIEPYGPDVAGFFINFAQVMGVSRDENGTMFRTYFLFNEATPNTPVQTVDAAKLNPVPAPGTASDPYPGESAFERIEEEPVPG